MPRYPEFPDVSTIRLPEGTLRAIAASLTEGETVSDFMRDAVVQKLARRQRGAAKAPPAKGKGQRAGRSR